MIRYTAFFALALLSICTACGGGGSQSVQDEATLAPLYGGDLEGVNLSQTASSVDVSVSEATVDGRFFRLSLPDGMVASIQDWSGASEVVALMVPTAEGAEFGVVATPEYSGGPVSMRVSLARGLRSASAPPSGDRNRLSDFTVTDIGGGQVQLSWTQVNVGDYDFNGEVNIADLTPLAGVLGQTYDRSVPGAADTKVYWLDGDGNGEVNIGDLAPIGQNYGAYINGYVLKKNGTPIAGAAAGDPTVLRSQSEPRAGLPPTYTVLHSGSATDEWEVVSVDEQGNEGAGNTGGGVQPVPVDLQTTINISGPDLYNLDGSGSGQFDGSGKFSTRVINPIDIVTRAPVGDVNTVGAQTLYTGLPRARRMIVDFRYAPTVNLATGGPKIGAKAKGASEVAEEDIVISAIPFPLPAGEEPVNIAADIELTENPEGGFFVDLHATIDVPGDNPATEAIVENGYRIEEDRRLEYANGEVVLDNDLDGRIDDEPTLADADRDMISEPGIDEIQYRDDNEDSPDDEEIEIKEGLVIAFDELAGSVTVEGILETAEEDEFPGVYTVRFSEFTEFEYENGGGHDPNIDPSTIQLGDFLDIEMFTYEVPGSPTAELWSEKIELLGPEALD
jgi:hypothetical protein